MGTWTRADAQPNLFARSLFHALPPRYDTLAWLLSFGQDRRWRAAVVEQIARAEPTSVLDVACGPAGITLAIMRATTARVVGVDLTEPMLRRGLENVRAANAHDRVTLALARAEELPFADETFDALSFSYLMRYVDDPKATIAELSRCVKPGGTIASLEFHVPPWLPARLTWHLYTRILLPLLGFLLGGPAWLRVGRFLGPSISGYVERYPSDAQIAHWQAAGMEHVTARRMSFGGGLVMWATKATPKDRADVA